VSIFNAAVCKYEFAEKISENFSALGMSVLKTAAKGPHNC
jgi:hypothetical protein